MSKGEEEWKKPNSVALARLVDAKDDASVEHFFKERSSKESLELEPVEVLLVDIERGKNKPCSEIIKERLMLQSVVNLATTVDFITILLVQPLYFDEDFTYKQDRVEHENRPKLKQDLKKRDTWNESCDSE